MILLYGFVMATLVLAAWLTGRRARGIERRYVRVAREADQLAKQLSYRGGNCNLPDPFSMARRQYELGRLVQVRDRLEEKHDVWENRAESCRKLRRSWLQRRGRLVPYLLGMVDVSGLTALLAATGLTDATQLRIVIDSVKTLALK